MKQPRAWIWMAHPAHFICARDCRFHLATVVNGYIVSTVGELWPSRGSREIHAKVHDPAWLASNQHLLGDYFDAAYFKKFGYETIGCDRTYETMVFKAVKDAQHRCCPYRMTGSELDFLGYNDPGDAYAGHLKLCRKWAKKR